jgi:hypothetical protein
MSWPCPGVAYRQQRLWNLVNHLIKPAGGERFISMNCAFAVTSNHLCQTRPRQHSEVVSLSLFDIERLPRLVSVSLVVCATILVIGIYGVVGVISVLDDDRMPCFLRVLRVRTLTLLRKHRTASSRCRVSEHTHHTQYSQLLNEHQLASRRNRSTVSSRVSAVRACMCAHAYH